MSFFIFSYASLSFSKSGMFYYYIINHILQYLKPSNLHLILLYIYLYITHLLLLEIFESVIATGVFNIIFLYAQSEIVIIMRVYCNHISKL